MKHKNMHNALLMMTTFLNQSKESDQFVEMIKTMSAKHRIKRLI